MEEVKENKSVVTSYRLAQDTKDKLKKQLDDMGMTQEQYFNKVVSIMELENVKQNNIFAVNATELQDLTQRIYNLFIGLCDQGNSFLSNKDTELEELKVKYKDMLFNKDNKITQLKDELQQVYNNLNIIQSENDNDKIELDKVKLEYDNQLEQLESNLKDKSLIVEEYTSKNNNLLKDLKEHEKYKIDLEEHKKLLSDAQLRELNLKNDLDANNKEVQKLNNDIEVLKQESQKELEQLKKELIFEKNKAILELKQEHQKAQEELNAKYNKEINEYQIKYKQLLQELEQTKKVTHKKTTGEGTAKGAK